MRKQLRIIHYINQFFAGIGGEEHNDTPLTVVDKPVGPGRLLKSLFGEQAQIVATIYCGDDYFVSNEKEVISEIQAILHDQRPDLVVTGPAFDAGRYGISCALVCKAAQDVGIPAVTGMHEDNPGITTYRHEIISVPTGETPIGMASELKDIVALAHKLLEESSSLGPGDQVGFAPTGIRTPYLRENHAAERSVNMLLARLKNEPFSSEISNLSYGSVVAPEPIKNLSSTKVAFITTAGVVPKGNPDQLSTNVNRRVMEYDISNLEQLNVDEWESLHSGFKGFIYNTVNPNYALPLPAFKEAERQGLIGSIYPQMLSVVGGGCPVTEAKRLGSEISARLQKGGVQAAIVAST